MRKIHPYSTSARSAFTLIELMISLVIIGLLIAGVTVARDLNRAAGLRGVMADIARYEGYVVTFRDKFSYLPGDFPGATNIWGIAGGTTGNDATCQAVASQTLTCNGDGNGAITVSAGGVNEDARAWQHLQNAELVETGNFRGTLNSMTSKDLLTKVFPPARMSGVGYQFNYESKLTQGWGNLPMGELTGPIQSLRVAGASSSVLALTANIFSPLDMYSIDEKLDDRKPGSGKIYIRYASNVGCVSNSNAQASIYIASNEQIGCYFNYSLTK